MNWRLATNVVIIFLTAATMRAAVLTVGDGKQFANITTAIANASDGDIIRVSEGIYEENLIIDKALTIEGIGRPILRGPGTGSVVLIAADDCVFRGFRVEHSGSDLQQEDAGILIRSKRNTVEDNDLKDILFGIYLYHAADNRIRQNRIVGRQEIESGERGAGLHLWNSPNNTLEGNEISFTRDGMYIQSSPNNTITGNRISNLRYGVHYMNSDSNSFENNVFFDNVAGGAIMYSQKIILRRNAFVHNRGFSSFGLLFQDCRSCIAEDNLILNNATGLFLEATLDSTFRRNTIAENDTAIQLFSSSSSNVFAENNFIDNLSPVRLVGRGGSTQWQSIAGGNYWSDYDGYDIDEDSYGDIPHKIQNIFEYLEGNFPRLRIYLNSPAAQSIILAEKSFPILKGSGEADARPLMHPIKSNVDLLLLSGSERKGYLLTVASIIMMIVSAFAFVRGISR